MFFTISRLGLALGAPALIAAQSLTTYSVTISNSVHEIVLPTPKVATVTEFVTNAEATTTIIPPASVETYIFTVTGPPPEVTSIADSIPSGARVLGGVSSEAPGAIVPVVIHGFTTSIEIPATASIPIGSVTIAPINIVAPTPTAVSSAASEAASVASQASSAASQEAVVAANVAGSATKPASIFETGVSSAASIATMAISNAPSAASVATSALTTINGIPTHIPIPLIPLISVSASVQSASSAAANVISTATSAAANAISSASSATATNALSSAEGVLSSEVSKTSVATAILSDTTIASTTATATSSAVAQTTLTTTTSSSAAAATTTTSSTSSSAAPPSSSSSAPSSSSTAAPPKSGAGRLESVWKGGVGVAAGVAAVVVMV